MKLMTFNIQHCLNYISREIDMDNVAEVIRRFSPDLLSLNEVYGKGERPEFLPQAEMLSELTDMPYFYFAKAIDVAGPNPYGVALLSRVPIASAEVIPIPDPVERGYDGYYETRCLLKAKLQNGLTVLVTHFGLNPDEQQNAVATVVQELEEKQCILMGDFNTFPENAVLDPIRARMQDTAQRFTRPLLSYPSDKPKEKIDYIFVSSDFTVVSADIPEIVASDHRPHIACIE